MMKKEDELSSPTSMLAKLGVKVRSKTKESLFLEREQKAMEKRIHDRRMKELADTGPPKAAKRVYDARRELWFAQQSVEAQRRMILKREARRKTKQNKIDRKYLIDIALFLFWKTDHQKMWVKDSILISLQTMHNLLNEKRNNRAKLDAFSQDYLTLLTSAYFPTETKIFMRIKRKIDATFFEDARNIRDKDIERAASRPSSQAREYLQSSKGSRPSSSKPSTPIKKSNRGSFELSSAATDISVLSGETDSRSRANSRSNSRPNSRSSSRPSSREREFIASRGWTPAVVNDGIANSEAEKKKFRPASVVLKEMVASYDKEVNRVYRYFAEQLARNFCNYKNSNKYVLVAFRAADVAAKKTIDNSKFLSILPKHQLDLKRLILRAEAMSGNYQFLKTCCHAFAKEIEVIDRGWARSLAVMLSLSLLQKFDAEADLRRQGEYWAAARIQSLFRMNSMRLLYKSVQYQLSIAEKEAEVLYILSNEERMKEQKAKEEKEKYLNDLKESQTLEGDVCCLYDSSLSSSLLSPPSSSFNYSSSSSSSITPHPASIYNSLKLASSSSTRPMPDSTHYNFHINVFFSTTGLDHKKNNNIIYNCLVLRHPTRTLPRTYSDKLGSKRGGKLQLNCEISGDILGHYNPLFSSSGHRHPTVKAKFTPGLLLFIAELRDNKDHLVDVLSKLYQEKVKLLPIQIKKNSRLQNVPANSIEDEWDGKDRKDSNHTFKRKKSFQVSLADLEYDQDYHLQVLFDVNLISPVNASCYASEEPVSASFNYFADTPKSKIPRYLLVPVQALNNSLYQPFVNITNSRIQIEPDKVLESIEQIMLGNNNCKSDTQNIEIESSQKLFNDSGIELRENNNFITLKFHSQASVPLPPEFNHFDINISKKIELDSILSINTSWNPTYGSGLPIECYELHRRFVLYPNHKPAPDCVCLSWELLSSNLDYFYLDKIKLKDLFSISRELSVGEIQNDTEAAAPKVNLESSDELIKFNIPKLNVKLYDKFKNNLIFNNGKVLVQYQIRAKNRLGLSPCLNEAKGVVFEYDHRHNDAIQSESSLTDLNNHLRILKEMNDEIVFLSGNDIDLSSSLSLDHHHHHHLSDTSDLFPTSNTLTISAHVGRKWTDLLCTPPSSPESVVVNKPKLLLNNLNNNKETSAQTQISSISSDIEYLQAEGSGSKQEVQINGSESKPILILAKEADTDAGTKLSFEDILNNLSLISPLNVAAK